MTRKCVTLTLQDKKLPQIYTKCPFNACKEVWRGGRGGAGFQVLSRVVVFDTVIEQSHRSVKTLLLCDVRNDSSGFTELKKKKKVRVC